MTAGPQESAGKMLFHEEQGLRHWWLWPAMTGSLALGVIAVVELSSADALEAAGGPGEGVIVSAGAYIAMLLGATVATLILSARLTTEVRSDGLYIQYFPLHYHFRHVPLANVVTVRPVIYHPLRELAALGTRLACRGRCYNITGNHGVRIDYANGKHVLIGTRRPGELYEAIMAVMPREGRA